MQVYIMNLYRVDPKYFNKAINSLNKILKQTNQADLDKATEELRGNFLILLE